MVRTLILRSVVPLEMFKSQLSNTYSVFMCAKWAQISAQNANNFSWCPQICRVREGVNGKKTFSFGHCPNDGGGGGGVPMPEFFGPLFRSAFLVKKKRVYFFKNANVLNF